MRYRLILIAALMTTAYLPTATAKPLTAIEKKITTAILQEKEALDLNSLTPQTQRAALLIYRLTHQ